MSSTTNNWRPRRTEHILQTTGGQDEPNIYTTIVRQCSEEYNDLCVMVLKSHLYRNFLFHACFGHNHLDVLYAIK